MASMCCEITTTRAISAQILRHRSFSFQEFSQRYALPTDLYPAPLPDIRRQDEKNRQRSIDDMPDEVINFVQDRCDKHFRDAVELYDYMISQGVAKECARAVLPINTATRLYMSGTIRSWLHYIDLRADNGTQLEHQKIARQVGEIFDTELPTISRAMWT